MGTDEDMTLTSQITIVIIIIMGMAMDPATTITEDNTACQVTAEEIIHMVEEWEGMVVNT
jgi:hypothetical protein